MSSFTDPLILEALPEERNGRGLFAVYQPFGYEVGYKGSGDWIRIPAGYVTDLCSLPWFARPFLPMSGKVAKPALLHDWLLELGDERAHEVFDEALRVADVAPTTRWVLGKAVRLWAVLKALRGA